jgi:hypothetical protein
VRAGSYKRKQGLGYKGSIKASLSAQPGSIVVCRSGWLLYWNKEAHSLRSSVVLHVGHRRCEYAFKAQEPARPVVEILPHLPVTRKGLKAWVKLWNGQGANPGAGTEWRFEDLLRRVKDSFRRCTHCLACACLVLLLLAQRPNGHHAMLLRSERRGRK